MTHKNKNEDVVVEMKKPSNQQRKAKHEREDIKSTTDRAHTATRQQRNRMSQTQTLTSTRKTARIAGATSVIIRSTASSDKLDGAPHQADQQ